MATLWIREYEKVGGGASRLAPCGQEPAAAGQAVTFTTSTQSAAFGANTNFVRVMSDADAYLDFGANPTAVSGDGLPVKANVPEYFAVYPGMKVAAVAA